MIPRRNTCDWKSRVEWHMKVKTRTPRVLSSCLFLCPRHVNCGKASNPALCIPRETANTVTFCPRALSPPPLLYSASREKSQPLTFLTRSRTSHGAEAGGHDREGWRRQSVGPILLLWGTLYFLAALTWSWDEMACGCL